MLDIAEIQLQPGVLPPRPASLIRHKDPVSDSTDDFLLALLEGGKVAVYGGLSLIGADGWIIYMVGIMQAKDGNFFGWTLPVGHPGHQPIDFCRIDTAAAPLTELPFPNTVTYFICEGKQELVAADADKDELKAIARFVLPFISDEGPPKGIDW